MIHILLLSVLGLFSHAQNLRLSQTEIYSRDPQSAHHCTAVGISKDSWNIRTADGGQLAPNISFGGFDINPKAHHSLICTTPDGQKIMAEIRMTPELRLVKRATFFRTKLEPLMGGGFEFHMVRSGSRKYCQITCR